MKNKIRRLAIIAICCMFLSVIYPMTKVSADETYETVAVGSKIQVDNLSGYTWSTKNKSVAKVSSKGYVTGVKKGSTTVYAKKKKKKYTYKIKVVAKKTEREKNIDTIISNIENEMSNTDGMIGHLYIQNDRKYTKLSSADISVKVVDYKLAQKGAQATTNEKEVACYGQFNGSKTHYIADHCSQEFKYLNLVEKGDIAYLYTSATTKEKYKCIASSTGDVQNTYIANKDGKDISKVYNSEDYIITYTCKLTKDTFGDRYYSVWQKC